MASATQRSEYLRLRSLAESSVLDTPVLNALVPQVEAADLDEDDRELLLGVIQRYVRDGLEWEQNSLPEDERAPVLPDGEG